MTNAALGMLLGILGTIASVLSLWFAYVQTRELNKVKRRSNKGLMLAMGEAASIVEQLVPYRDTIPRAYQATIGLHGELLKEAAVQESTFDEQTIQRWYEIGLLGEWQLDTARRLLDSTPKRKPTKIEIAVPVPIDIRNSGLRSIYKLFPMDDVIQKIRTATRSIRIYTTWLNDLHRVEPAIQEAIREQRCQARILLIDPDSIVARQRSDDIKRVSAEYVMNSVKNNLQELMGFFNAAETQKGTLEVRLYRSYPTFLMYAWDDHIVYSTILKGCMTMEGPQFAIGGTDTPLYKLIDSQFETVWETAQCIFSLGHQPAPLASPRPQK